MEIKHKTKATAKSVNPLGTKGIGTLKTLKYYDLKNDIFNKNKLMLRDFLEGYTKSNSGYICAARIRE